MERSSELEELYIQMCEAQTNGDYSFFERLFSKRDGVLAIGTDPTEWWSGYETISRIFKAQLKEISGFKLLADTPRPSKMVRLAGLRASPHSSSQMAGNFLSAGPLSFKRSRMAGRSSNGTSRSGSPTRICLEKG